MNAFELTAQLLQFRALKADIGVTGADKRAIYAEMLTALPAAMLCRSAATTRAIIERQIKEALSAEIDGAAGRAAPQDEAPESRDELKDGGQQPVRSAVEDAGRARADVLVASKGKKPGRPPIRRG